MNIPRQDAQMTFRHRSAWLAATLALALVIGGSLVWTLTRTEAGTQAVEPPTVPVVPPWRQELIPRERPLMVTVGDVAVLVEVANTPRERSLGLGYRDGLLPNTGMLFVFDGRAPQSFWMGGMRFCLDIIWIADDEIVGAATSTCPGPPGESQDLTPRHSSPRPIDYVLEVPAGFLAEHELGVGTRVTFSNDPTTIATPIP